MNVVWLILVIGFLFHRTKLVGVNDYNDGLKRPNIFIACFIISNKFKGFRVPIIDTEPFCSINNKSFPLSELKPDNACSYKFSEASKKYFLLHCSSIKHSASNIFISKINHDTVLVPMFNNAIDDIYFLQPVLNLLKFLYLAAHRRRACALNLHVV